MLLITERGQAQKAMKSLREKGARGGTILFARGTASSSLLAALGLGDSRKEVLISLLDEDINDTITGAVRRMRMKGAVMAELSDRKDIGMKMIEIIAEKGYADDIMAAARKAGATGGTVIEAHGTASDEDVKFFGSPIVPEKEILLIIAKDEIADAVTKAVCEMECLKKKGMGIVFTIPVSEFATLG